MRITGGILCGRRIAVPKKGVRPTKDRVRESLFAMLSDNLRDARVLDIFAGSGSLGLEAVSRGAKEVCWVERDRRTFQTLKQNVNLLTADQACTCRCVCNEALRFIKAASPDSYSLVFADPPYGDNIEDLLENILSALDKSGCIAQGGMVIYEMGSSKQVKLSSPWRVLRDKKWGETRVLIIAREE